MHIPIPNNGQQKGQKLKERQQITKTEFQKCSPNSVLKVEPKQNQFWNPHIIKFGIKGEQNKIFILIAQNKFFFQDKMGEN